jgi:hypothetical protein
VLAIRENLITFTGNIMKYVNKIEISDQEYFEKRYQVAKDLLCGAITNEQLDSSETKKQESLLFNCIFLSDMLLKELGYFCNSTSEERTGVHNLSDLLSKDDEE